MFENTPPLRGEQFSAFLTAIDSHIYHPKFPRVLSPNFMYEADGGLAMLRYIARCFEALLLRAERVAGVVRRHSNLNERLALAFALQLQKSEAHTDLKVIGIDGSSGFRFAREGIFTPPKPVLRGDTLVTVRGYLKPQASVKEEADFFRSAFGPDKKLLVLSILDITKRGDFDNLALPVEVRSLINAT